MQRPDFSARAHDVLRVLEVHDGDTVRLLLDCSFEQCAMPWLRLKDYSCPELSKTDPAGDLARAATDGLLREHLATCWVVTYKIPPDVVAKQAERYGTDKRSFARYIAEIWLNDDVKLGDVLVALGHARPGAFVG